MASPGQIGQLEPVPAPSPWPDVNRRLLLGNGVPIDPLVRLASFTDEQFERFIWEWVNGYVVHKYFEVQHRGAAGDKGRDVIGWLDNSSASPRRWHLYQCKNYKDKLSPGDFWVELGKVCYYSFRGDYTIPDKYFIVSPKGVGNSLQDLIDAPLSLRQKLIEKWDAHCRKKITNTEVLLGGAFKDHVEHFDFSIVKTVSPPELIEQHRQTRYHLAVFGTSFKPRPPVPLPPAVVSHDETNYVLKLYAAFSDHLKCTVSNPQDFDEHTHLTRCFAHARECFYSAEALKEFSRDNLPDDTQFTDLCEQVLQGVTPTLNKVHEDGYEKLVDVSEKAVSVAITSNILVSEVVPSDRVGLCHQLANNGVITWVK
jgi:hypothetical protein